MVLFLLFLTGAFANTFELKGSANDFTLIIDARKMNYSSTLRKVERELKKCNLQVARALNGELLTLQGATENKDGFVFRVDGNTYQIGRSSKEADYLLGMERRIGRFLKDEKAACP